MRRIRNQVLLLILVPTTLIYSAMVGLGYFYFNSTYKIERTDRKHLELDKASRAINDWLVSRIADLVLLSRTKNLRDAEIGEIQTFLKEEQYRLAFVYEKYWYIDRDYRYWNTNDQKGILNQKQLIQDFFEEGRLLKYVAPIQLLPRDSNFSIFIAVPVVQQEEVKAVVGATISIDAFKRVFENFTKDIFDEIMLVNPQGVFITHTDSNLVGKNEETRYGQVFTSDSEMGPDQVFVATLRNSWKMVGVINNQLLYQPLNQINRFAIGFFLITFIIIAFVSIGISQIIAKPINTLTNKVKRLMRGDFNQEISLNATEELNSLALAFNQLNHRFLKIRTDDRFILLGRLSARMAHEIRRPLHLIQLIVQNLKQKKNNEEKELDLITEAIEQADRFIKEILEVAKPDQLSLSLQSMTGLLSETIEKFEIEAKQRNVLMKKDLQSDVPPFYFDLFKIEQVFSNIIFNALESIGNQGVLEVKLLLSISGDIIIEFIDSGAGFDSEIIDKVFDPYFTTKENGTGLGLSICSRMLMAHGAKIEVFNRLEGGALVKITFPITLSNLGN
ncbi:MAG: hypothetical protein HQM13_11370 [SAR324 cluster bacterium]|nr:hypothetical protein [SAR324 cluster bacterium]